MHDAMENSTCASRYTQEIPIEAPLIDLRNIKSMQYIKFADSPRTPNYNTPREEDITNCMRNAEVYVAYDTVLLWRRLRYFPTNLYTRSPGL